MSDTPPIQYCANHPQVETSLRCNRCEKPICPKCAVYTPTGYRCKECVRGQQKVFETAVWYDLPVAFLVAGALAFLGALFFPRLGFFTFFLTPVAGVVIAEAVRLLVRKRRSSRLFQITALGVVLGSLPPLLFALLPLFFGELGSLWNIFLQGFYLVTAASTAYYRLSGITVRR
ncbi:MAG: B-box zinc finger protein [Chloroflexi bacterium]|nr:B-box zinc finger protein [Chloroflexota bacterium]